jgi:hypothetical protein
MSKMDGSGYQSGESTSSTLSSTNANDDQLRELVSGLISASTNLDIRMWLDGIYTEIDNSQGLGNRMKGREVYFKIEGKVDDSRASDRSDH